ncbi:hypothetical protein MNBD_ALPHA02-418 [hydrothermal vent metagenome]|uniref:Uncharacterized protein n=1 Tax=hydrothermal vent metagenome TaxID=652676 RepID=A0A3B0RUG5_9ZZZZ
MKKGNYKGLIVKLSATAFGLVVMLFGAAVMGQKFLVDQHENSNSIEATQVAKQSDMDIKIELNRQFGIITESGVVDIKATLKEVRQTLADIKVDMVAELNDTIRDVEQDTSIPTAIKQTVIIQLERELQKNEQRFRLLEERALQFSYKIILPRPNYADSSKCDEKTITEETRDTDLDADTKGNNRDVRKAFSWI